MICCPSANDITVGWTGPFPTLSRKKPTASLVSRKVLTPLLGQITLCVLVQMIGFKAVQQQSWYGQLLYLCPCTNVSKVHSAEVEYREIEYRELAEHYFISCVLLPVYLIRRSTEYRATIQEIALRKP